MSDIYAINYTGKYSGLLSSLYLTVGIGGLCLIGFETLRHVPRRRGQQGAKIPKNHRIYRRTPRRARLSGDESTNTADYKKRRIFSWAYWRAGKHNNIAVHEENEAHELQERHFKEGFKNLGKNGFTDDRAARAGMVQRLLGSRESWEFSYLYENRCWNAINPAEPLPKWPFVWIYSIIMFPERDLPGRVGLDCTAHSRFLRGCLWYIFLHLCTTMVVLAPLHIFYAPDEIGSESMNKAGIRSAQNPNERRWLWVHVVLLYWMVITWIGNLIWVIWGVLMYRKEEIRKRLVALKNEYGGHKTEAIQEDGEEREMSELLPGRKSSIGNWPRGEHAQPNLQRDDRVDATQISDGEPSPTETEKTAKSLGLDAPGWKRYRTIMVTNIPPAMRDEKHLHYYFSEHLHKPPPPKQWKHAATHFVKKQAGRAQAIAGTPKPSMDISRTAMGSMLMGVTDVAVSTGMTLSSARNKIVEDVVLVHKLGELGRLRQRRDAVIKQLETAHVRLAQRVMNDISKFRDTISTPNTPKRDSLEKLRSSDGDGLIGKNVLLTALEPFMPGCQPHHARESTGDETLAPTPGTVWEALLSVPREYLDPYQPLTHRFERLHKDNMPLIDYLSAKLAVLTEKLEKAKEMPLEDYQPSSTAFVTFRTAGLARRALAELPSSDLYPLGCQTRPCPHYSDLIWPRLSKSVYRAAVFRGWVIGVVIFITTIAWIFPVSGVISLASVGTLANVFPALQDYLVDHQRLASFITNTIPVILVASISLAICPLLLVVANKAETLVTGYDVHNAVIHRFWIFQVVNIVIFFCIGRTAVESYITSRFRPQNVLNNVADSFPAAAPYYASYFLIQTSIQSMAELARVGLPLIFYLFSMRKAFIPRVRDFRLAHSTVSWFLQLPNAVLAVSICNLFCLYNPLVLPFCFVYLFAAHISYRRSYLYIYGRRYENNGKRNCIRYLRYSLDVMLLTCFSMLAFMILAKQKALAALSGILLPILAFIKIGLTRIVKARFARLRGEEADGIDAIRRMVIVADVDDNDVMEESKVWRTLARPCRFLDRWFTLKVDTTLDRYLTSEKRPIMPACPAPPLGGERLGQKDHKGHEIQVVRQHSYNPYWDDLPSPSRMTNYTHQPWYHDPLETFLWLPRDPMSELDLEDTIELRACITTSETDVTDIWEDHVDIEKMIAVADDQRQARHSTKIGIAVDDDLDMADDPDVSFAERLNHRLHRLTRTERTTEDDASQHTNMEASASAGSGLSRTPAVRRRRTRGKSAASSFPGGSNILHAAQEEERAAERKARDQEAKEAKAENKRQEDSMNGVRTWKSLYRSNRRSEVVTNTESGVV